MEFKSYQDFWYFYLTQHSKPTTRRWHFVGTTFVCLFLLMVLITFNLWLLLLAPFVGYSFAWVSHFYIEGNKPATFGHPLWSLRADFQMYIYFLTGKLDEELIKAGVK
ncbi:membrane protein [Bacillus coahuilensis p1.1.43]|uniref:Membrane protein n=1 Tax=Bacillus coahuilensis p1.1.43 TaxID=1150625 RepID=A0A147KBS6_9BACI|nr:DUF962 domain-containing protein [Bacillus coahuilensis]KUP08745.1 membrane protein [Bacillus coahuilensis p1.1.43]